MRCLPLPADQRAAHSARRPARKVSLRRSLPVLTTTRLSCSGAYLGLSLTPTPRGLAFAVNCPRSSNHGAFISLSRDPHLAQSTPLDRSCSSEPCTPCSSFLSTPLIARLAAHTGTSLSFLRHLCRPMLSSTLPKFPSTCVCPGCRLNLPSTPSGCHTNCCPRQCFICHFQLKACAHRSGCTLGSA
ncbi:hypothetical protein P171DRAFT_163005 [Karstenula rhodostoma CBS 690.94]|uniref:Uncharacterized protein n=1 Tax=Karstenula rhodostoma CBS 690.94 TaxID=1392251 RepID=A0A9P4P798_9PLEO|nr:hypothetical protein P171DRAFT_163005 [Karstenula rhodostoma CBS 690.94]